VFIGKSKKKLKALIQIETAQDHRSMKANG